MSLEGWDPDIGPYLTVSEVVEFAFDYRGNTTVVKTDGTAVVGYVFNRDRSAPEPFLELFEEAGDGPIVIPYAQIATIRFTGKDMAAGNTWKAWLERRERERAGGAGGDQRERSADPHGG